MENPFESGHIKNYLLLYASVVVIMILFFIASTLFHEVEDIPKKIFTNEVSQKSMEVTDEKLEKPKEESRFKLLEKGY